MSAVPSEDENMNDQGQTTPQESTGRTKMKKLPLVSLPLSIEFYDKLDPKPLER